MSSDTEYQRLACERLGLVHPDDKDDCNAIFLDLGFFRIIESDAALDAVMKLYLKKLRKRTVELQQAYHDKSSHLSKNYERNAKRIERLDQRKSEYDQALKTHAVLTAADFLKYNGHADAELKREADYLGNYGAAAVRNIGRATLAEIQRYIGFPSSRAGYRDYLRKAAPALAERLSINIPALVLEEQRQTHSYILSTTKTGKSELLKALCLNYIQRPDYAGLVVLDPGGDMVPQIARWPELIATGQLVYIDPALDQDVVPVINPFDAEGLGERERSLLTGQIVAALGTLVEGKLGGVISVPMQAALYPSVRLLIDLPDTSLKDLQEIMRGDQKLLDLGRNSQNLSVSDFFVKDYENVHRTTRSSIVSKISSVLNKGVLDKVLCGRTSIDLKSLLEANKIVLVNVAKGRLDPEETSALGTLIISTLQAIAMKRVDSPEHLRPMTHLIVDECQNFVTGEIKTIIRETRKFGLAVTLAQQELGAEMPDDLRKTVTKTTNVKIVGRSAPDETRKTADLAGVDSDEIRACEAGEFFYQAGTKPAFKLHVRSDRLKAKRGVDGRTWHKIQDVQKQLYYRASDATDQNNNENIDKGDGGAKPSGKTGYNFE